MAGLASIDPIDGGDGDAPLTHLPPETHNLHTKSTTNNNNSISHDIADGGSIAGFLLAWALASTGQPFPPAAHDRAILREVPTEEKRRIAAMPIPEGLLRMNLWKVGPSA